MPGVSGELPRKRRVAAITTHVIQYQDPFFRLLAAEPDIDLTVLFCSRAGAARYRDEEMGTSLQWDLPMLEGYRHRFLANLAWQGASGGFWRCANPGIAPALIGGRYDAALFMLGWGVFSAWLGFVACRLAGIPFYLFGDSSYVPAESTLRARLRAGLIRALFTRASGFLVSGRLNAEYYLHYGADAGRFYFVPWAIDNDRFERASRLSLEERRSLRDRHGFDPETVVALFSGKLIPRKDPMIVLRSLARARHRDRIGLLFVGDGELRRPLEEFARSAGLRNVRFAGFVNQTELPRLYAAADVFVLPSWDDPRATVVNEAMVCGLPVILTDRCGPVGDIARDGENALVIAPGDEDALARGLDRLAESPELRADMGRRSREIMATWTYEAGVRGIRIALGLRGDGDGRSPAGDPLEDGSEALPGLGAAQGGVHGARSAAGGRERR